MSAHELAERRILVVEDEYMLADEIRWELLEAGAIVLGPVGTLEEALALIGAEDRIDNALLDLSLHGEPAYPVADLLIERSVPVVLTTGYDTSSVPHRFSDMPRCEKPINFSKLVQAIVQSSMPSGSTRATGEVAERIADDVGTPRAGDGRSAQPRLPG